MDPKLTFFIKVDPDGNFPVPRCRVPVCLLLSDLQLAAVCAGAVIPIVKVAVLVEDESYMRVVAMWIHKNVSDSGKFGFSLIWDCLPRWIWLLMTCMASFRRK
jgi:hypothetical protein